ncbi:MAG: Sir2 family NAD-dependent protein deacetylase [Desulfitobacteriaceae bacterium]|nr:Sir2 family NAD-dependent protein deacetylase [Desulfitobacteriaceae bacterium]
MEKLILRAAELIAQARKVVAFTGAGVSTESGIPDFRSPGGIWEKYEPVYYQDFLTSAEARKKYWLRSRATYPVIREAKPNPTHLALVELEKMGKLDCIITQNIDRLHHKAGNSPEKIIEIHGTNAYVICLRCKKSYPREEIQDLLESKEEIEPPLCRECNGPLKEATISFGQPMPEKEMAEAERRAQTCDLMLTLGSSLVVYPAAYLPQYARQAGARMIIINMTQTPFDHLADVAIHGKTGEVLPWIVEEVKKIIVASGD